MFSQSLPIVFLEAIAQRMDFSQVAILQTVPGAHVFLGRLGNCQFSWWIYGSSDSNWAGWTMFFFFMTIWVREDTHINIHSPAILGIPTGYLVPGFGLPRWGSGNSPSRSTPAKCCCTSWIRRKTTWYRRWIPRRWLWTICWTASQARSDRYAWENCLYLLGIVRIRTIHTYIYRK